MVGRIYRPTECSLCEQQLHYLNQSYLALGKNKERVTAVVFVAEGVSLKGTINKPDLEFLAGGDQLREGICSRVDCDY